jgi:hypothetical protein
MRKDGKEKLPGQPDELFLLSCSFLLLLIGLRKGEGD